MKKTAIRASLFWVGLIVFLLTTQPAKLPVPFLVLPYILLYGALFFSIKSIFVHYMSKESTHRGLLARLPSIIAAVIVLLLALQSVGQLSVRDVVAVLLLVVVGYFYAARNRAN